MRKTLFSIIMVLISTIFALFLAEMIARAYFVFIDNKSKIYQSDDVLGWKMIENLDTEWKNADGDTYTIRTNENGQRSSASEFPTSGKKALIIGDSFSFGQGVDEDDRFDKVLDSLNYTVINTGVMGYGTDQSYISAKEYIPLLDSNDLIVLTMYTNVFVNNDFHETARKRSFGGRAKPWFEIKDDKLELHNAELKLHDKLLPNSYLYTKLSTYYFDYDDPSLEDTKRAAKIIELIIDEMIETNKGNCPQIVLIHYGLHSDKHGTYQENYKLMQDAINGYCERDELQCIDVGALINFYDTPQYFLRCGHWTVEGNSLVSNLLLELVDR